MSPQTEKRIRDVKKRSCHQVNEYLASCIRQLLAYASMASKSFTFICGSDDFLVTRQGKVIFDELTHEIDDDFAKEIISGTTGNVTEVEKVVSLFRDAVQTLPLFGNKKFVWFKDVNFLGDSVTGRAEGTLSQVALMQDILKGIDPQSATVIVTACPIDRRRSFPKWCEANGDFHIIDEGHKNENDLSKLLEDERLELGVEINPDAGKILIEKLNGNARLIVEEMRKLATYLGEEGGCIEETHVAELVPNFGEGDFFEVAEAFFTLDLEWTLDAIRRHFFNNNDARPLINSMQNRNRLMIQLRVIHDAGLIRLGERGLNQSHLDEAARTYGKHFGESNDKSNFNIFTQNPWYLGRLGKAAVHLNLKNLIDFQCSFIKAFEEILKRPNEQESVMRETAIHCLG